MSELDHFLHSRMVQNQATNTCSLQPSLLSPRSSPLVCFSCRNPCFVYALSSMLVFDFSHFRRDPFYCYILILVSWLFSAFSLASLTVFSFATVTPWSDYSLFSSISFLKSLNPVYSSYCLSFLFLTFILPGACLAICS